MATTMKLDEYPTGRTVPFPYQNPYPQQVDLMDAILSGLRAENQQHRVMFLESPTGTGKSLSLACASIAWLRYQEQLDLSEQTDKKESDSNENWWETHTATRVDEVYAKQAARAARRSLETALQELRDNCTATNNDNLSVTRHNRLRLAITQARITEKQRRRKRKRKTLDSIVDDEDEDDQAEKNHDMCSNSLSSQYMLYGPRLDGSSTSNNNPITVGEVQAGSGVRKIIYAARTHTQLSQFTREIIKIAGANIRVVTLAGRSHMCGFLQNQGLSDRMINEKCLDMQKETSSNKKCPYLASKESISTLALHVLATPTEIEEVASMGKAVQTCAYYASRNALAAAEVVVVPYSMLLCSQTRQALGFSLKSAFVIIDEAHNVPEALQSLHATRLKKSVLSAALEQLQNYTAKYAQRLCGENVQIISQLCRMLRVLESVLSTNPGNDLDSRIMTATELLLENKLESINLFRILNYMEQTRLSQKLLGFQQTQNQDSLESDVSKHISAMSIVQDFIEKLTHGSSEGKVVVEWPKGNVKNSREDSPLQQSLAEASFRYVLLHPAAFFDTVLKEAHAVALVGGTLSPFCHVAAELLGVDSDFVRAAERADHAIVESMSTPDRPSLTFRQSNVTAFTCNHVIPPSNVLLQCVGHGPTRQKLDFRHEQRFQENVCQELGRAVLELCKVVPHGVVLFFPSYSYEGHVVRRWKAAGLWKELAAIKKTYREPKSSQTIDATLASYSHEAATSGALLLAVMGGKMSEGINFADEMARCVGIIGLPYPDITDPVLQEKMTAMDAAGGSGSVRSTITGRTYYHNLCMRAVNQSIGRAIRHARDYASIVLFDTRYATDNKVWTSLPHWVKTPANINARKEGSFQQKLYDMQEFFANRTS